MTSKAQLDANRRYKRKHPERQYYERCRSASLMFARLRTEKAMEAIQTVGVDKYRKDLEKLRDEITERLRTLEEDEMKVKKLTTEQVFSALMLPTSAAVENLGEETRVVYYLHVKEDGTIVDCWQEADICFSDGIPYSAYADTLEEFKEIEDLFDGTYEDMSWKPFADVVEELTDWANEWLENVERDEENCAEAKNQIISFLIVNDYGTDVLLKYLEDLGDVSWHLVSDFDMWVRKNNISPSKLMTYNLCEFHITDAIFTLTDGMNLKNLVSMSEETGRTTLSRLVGEVASYQMKAPRGNAEIQKIIDNFR